MGFPKYIFFTSLFFFLFLPVTRAQIVFKELPGYRISDNDSLFFDISTKRKIIPLNGTWKVHPADDEDAPKIPVIVPSVFQGEGELIFEKSFSISQNDLKNYQMKLIFFGINYSADISVNKNIIYRHTGGEFPFQLDLPKDILYIDKSNIISVRLKYKLDSENTIPVKQRFMFPQNFGGIIRDVYIHLIPNISLTDADVSYKFFPGLKSVAFQVKSRVENKEYTKPADTLSEENGLTYKIRILSPDSTSIINSVESKFTLLPNKDKSFNDNINIADPLLWDTSNPRSYIILLELWRNDHLIDMTKRSIAVYSILSGGDSLLFNGKRFELKGVTYCPSNGDYGNLNTYSGMERDIKIIKETGFNAVRFTKVVPHPYYLALCQKYGLLAFIELPISSIPSDLAQSSNFIERSKNFLSNFIRGYKSYTAVVAVGLGSGYLSKVDAHLQLIYRLNDDLKRNWDVLSYASFAYLNIEKSDSLDLCGIELINVSTKDAQEKLNELKNKLGSRFFISSATYTVNTGNSDGYLNKYSYEAQAKYFEEIIDYSESSGIAGFFLNSMYDYRGDFSSLINGYNEENIYNIGIAGEDRSTNRLTYKVVFAKLHDAEPVTIPIGSKKDNAPMVFIIFGLFLALIMGVLVNSGRKFREDSSRALLRPYNFYADVRDQRIMSGYHSTILGFVISAILALLVSNILFYLRDNILFERILLSFGSENIISDFSYLSWHPTLSLLWLTIIFIIMIPLLSIVIKGASFFVRTKVFISSIYYTTIWSLLPMVLLIPVGIILYRMLEANVANVYIYLGLLVFLLWSFYRLVKGIYVIFDVTPGTVYFYSILLILAVIGIFILYYQVTNSVIEYMDLVFLQFNG
ncbi:MAG TPA: glycoside hydrolase family 2 TIM barrel-domain containing protein [Ignavibacteriaceae bacterium]|nr:glycoside hydrolase family 2 TIM barrel-domain containing protein [Ignavibacteriaceae bacterium]